MNIEIKKSIKPVKYEDALDLLEARLKSVHENKDKELIWILEHEPVYTAGTSFSDNEVLDKSIKLVKTNRGGKVTFHGQGQLIFYFVIDLKKRKKDIRKFISIIENTIIETLDLYEIKSFIDINNKLEPYNKIIPCGITDKGVTNLKKISSLKFDKIDEILIKKFISNLKTLNV